MKIIFVAITMLSCVSGQFLFSSNGPTINGFYGGYHFEYHKSHRLLLVKDSLNCYLVVVDNVLETAIENGGATKRIEAEVLEQIKAGTRLSDATRNDIKNDFHDYLAAAQCSIQAIHKLDYKFGSVSTTSALSTPTHTVTKAQTTVTDAVTQGQTTVTDAKGLTTTTEAVTQAQTTVTDAKVLTPPADA